MPAKEPIPRTSVLGLALAALLTGAALPAVPELAPLAVRVETEQSVRHGGQSFGNVSRKSRRALSALTNAPTCASTFAGLPCSSPSVLRIGEGLFSILSSLAMSRVRPAR